MKKLLILLTFLVTSHAWAQQKEISGNIIDESGTPLAGTSVLVKGTTTETTTDFDGNYTIKVMLDQVLVFSYIGYDEKEVRVSAPSTINVQMKESEVLENIRIVVCSGVKRNEKGGSCVTEIRTEDIQSYLRIKNRYGNENLESTKIKDSCFAWFMNLLSSKVY